MSENKELVENLVKILVDSLDCNSSCREEICTLLGTSNMCTNRECKTCPFNTFIELNKTIRALEGMING